MTSTAIESTDITDRLVGISPLYLNNFLQRKLYGLRPSIQKGEVRAKRRVFSADDVYGIALVWMLFEAGFRSEAIARVLNEIGGTRKSDANSTARKLVGNETEYIIVIRQPRKPGRGGEQPEIRVETATRLTEAIEFVEENRTANLVLIPVGQKFADIKRRLEILY